MRRSSLAVVLLTASFLFVASAQNGLTSVIGQQHAMTGQVSAVWNVFLSIPTVGALLIGGKLSGHARRRKIRIRRSVSCFWSAPRS